jgi:DNA-binding NtrC family response regulator
VISDFQMCGGDGLRFVLDARQLYPHLPIVLISGFVRPAGNASTEYFEFLQKPFSRSMLLESIARARQKVRRTNTGTA